MYFIVETDVYLQQRTFSTFLSPRSNAFTASFKAFTTSAGLFWDFPNRGMFS